MERLAYMYVRLLLLIETLLFTSSLALHMSVLIGARTAYSEYSLTLFRGTVIVGVLAGAFIKDGLQWMNQVKSCPEWMWRVALSLGGYVLLVGFLEALVRSGVSFSEHALTLSGLPLGIDAIYSCILYSALRPAYLNKSEVVDRARNSLIVIILGVIVFSAYSAGYLRHP